MSLGHRDCQMQESLWVLSRDIPQAPGHPFYCELNRRLAKAQFDRFVEELDGTAVLSYSNGPDELASHALKRIFDAVVSGNLF